MAQGGRKNEEKRLRFGSSPCPVLVFVGPAGVRRFKKYLALRTAEGRVERPCLSRSWGEDYQFKLTIENLTVRLSRKQVI
jgi:hypothetical protein